MFKYIVMCLCLGGNGFGCSRLFFCVYPTPAPPLKGAGSCDDHNDDDDDDDDDDGG